MRKIRHSDVIKFLNENNVNFIIQNKEVVCDEYTVASLFNAIDYGFYYFSGDKFDFNIKNSLIFANKPIQSDRNSIILIKDIEVQMLYYKLLQYYYGKKSNGLIDKFTKIDSEAVIGDNVQIDAFTEVNRCIIGKNVIIGSHCKIYDDVVIEDDTIIESGSIIGTRGIAWTWNEDQSEKIIQPQLGGVLIKKGCIIGANTILVRGSLNENTTIGKYCHLAPGCRLGHGTKIGNYTHLANAVITGGNTVIGNYCFIGSNAVFRPKVKIDDSTVVGLGSVVVKNTTTAGKTLMGVPAKEFETKDKLSGMPKPKK
ncbi:hypothetical protein [Aequorivita sinensis]|uniref:hypothetical protein n=1 Tax=Aequorivita sinensis TaxID=1382458 RepID=UPI002300C98B|nr:hypothetical protein [Aequorivita sinensis]